jgi:hypothetical protein
LKNLEGLRGEVCLGNRDIGSSHDIAVIGKATPQTHREAKQNLPRISVDLRG